MTEYIKTEFFAGPKDGDKRRTDRTKSLYFVSRDFYSAHMYSFVDGMMRYQGLVERDTGDSQVESLTVGTER